MRVEAGLIEIYVSFKNFYKPAPTTKRRAIARLYTTVLRPYEQSVLKKVRRSGLKILQM